MMQTMNAELTTQEREFLCGVVDSLKEDIDDEVTWNALHDYLQDKISAWPKMSRALLAQEACWLLAEREGKQQIQHVIFPCKYCEPGYSGEQIAVGNWNTITRWDNDEKKSKTICNMPRVLGELLEKLGYSLEWSDEWSECNDCGGIVRTQPDSHSWTPSYVITEGELLCLGCAPKEEPIEERCDRCQLLRINGIVCHETGCPNNGAEWDDESQSWIHYCDCAVCGYPVARGESCSCEDSNDDEEEKS